MGRIQQPRANKAPPWVERNANTNGIDSIRFGPCPFRVAAPKLSKITNFLASSKTSKRLAFHQRNLREPVPGKKNPPWLMYLVVGLFLACFVIMFLDAGTDPKPAQPPTPPQSPETTTPGNDPLEPTR